MENAPELDNFTTAIKDSDQLVTAYPEVFNKVEGVEGIYIQKKGNQERSDYETRVFLFPTGAFSMKEQDSADIWSITSENQDFLKEFALLSEDFRNHLVNHGKQKNEVFHTFNGKKYLISHYPFNVAPTENMVLLLNKVKRESMEISSQKTN
jgi:hypothetical protein